MFGFLTERIFVQSRRCGWKKISLGTLSGLAIAGISIALTIRSLDRYPLAWFLLQTEKWASTRDPPRKKEKSGLDSQCSTPEIKGLNSYRNTLDYPPGGRLPAGVRSRPTLIGTIILYMCKVFNHKSWEFLQSIWAHRANASSRSKFDSHT